MTTGTDDVVLETRGLSIDFGGLRAVDNVDVVIRRGGITSIIGPNGAGKSTFFNLVSGALRPTAGTIFIEGRNVTGLQPFRMNALGLARSFQITNLFSQTSVFENLRLAAQVLEPGWHGVLPVKRSTRAEAKAEELIGRFGLAHKATELAGHLSHGEQRRLEIAVALASEPKILILDEPTQGMSHADTEDASGLVRALGENMTVVLIEHDIDLVMDLSHTVIVLHQGRKLAEGSPSDVRNNQDVQTAYFGAH
ncbi:MAG: ABC transporter ATP-binding protein [Hyphomicrobiaceae bacterium]